MQDFVDGAICPMTSPALTPWLTRPIKSCSDPSPNASLVLHHLLKEKPTPVCFLRARSHNFILPRKGNRNFISRALYHAVSVSPPHPDGVNLVSRLQERLVEKQYFHVNTYASVTKVSTIKEDLLMMMMMTPLSNQIAVNNTTGCYDIIIILFARCK